MDIKNSQKSKAERVKGSPKTFPLSLAGQFYLSVGKQDIPQMSVLGNTERSTEKTAWERGDLIQEEGLGQQGFGSS